MSVECACLLYSQFDILLGKLTLRTNLSKSSIALWKYFHTDVVLVSIFHFIVFLVYFSLCSQFCSWFVEGDDLMRIMCLCLSPGFVQFVWMTLEQLFNHGIRYNWRSKVWYFQLFYVLEVFSSYKADRYHSTWKFGFLGVLWPLFSEDWL